MPRNSSGVYQLPAGNPVVSGTLIESVWANATMSDVAQALTDSLDRYGRSTMAAPLLANDGTMAAPGVAFGSEASSGLYRKSSKVLGISVGGTDVVTYTQAGITLPKGIVGDFTMTGGIAVGPGRGISGTGTTSGGWTVGPLDAALGSLLLNGTAAATATLDINAMPVDGTSPAAVRLFRSTNTTGTRQFQIMRGDGSNTSDHLLASGATAVSSLARNGGRVLIGTTTDNTLDTLQVALSARVRNGASGVASNAAALAGYDEFVIEGSGAVGMSFLSPNNVVCGIAWGDPQGLGQGWILYNHSIDQLQLGAAGASNLILDAAYSRSTVPVYVPDGTAAAPSYAFTTQPTWGMFRVPAIGIGFAVSGVEAARIAAAGMTLSAGIASIMHGDTTTQLNVCAAASLVDATARLELYDSAHATLARQLFVRGKQIVFTDSTAANEKARFSANATGELLLNTASVGTYSLANRALLRMDGSAGSLIGMDYNNVRAGYIISHVADMMISSGPAMALILAFNNTEVARVDTDSTFQYKGIEVGFRGLGATTVGNYTLAAADRGRMVWNNVVSTTITVPTGFAQGDIFTVFNISGNNISITAGSGMAFRWGTGASVSTTATRTLAAWGCANIIIGPAGTQAIISGTGLS
jgi:hypothetical protein